MTIVGQQTANGNSNSNISISNNIDNDGGINVGVPQKVVKDFGQLA